MKELIHIEEILTEASAYGQRERVKEYSKVLNQAFNNITDLDSYLIAYDMIITNDLELN